MPPRTKIIWMLCSFFCLTAFAGIAFVACQKVLSLQFRATNDILHQQGSPITLDFLIQAGIYIDDSMTIEQVVRLRFARPKGMIGNFVQRVSKSIPLKYRFLGTTALYLFWTFLFLVFFRIFTWMRYITALSTSFLAGALVYGFMPDLITGRLDDLTFWGWALAFWGAVYWYSTRKKMKAFHA